MHQESGDAIKREAAILDAIRAIRPGTYEVGTDGKVKGITRGMFEDTSRSDQSHRK